MKLPFKIGSRVIVDYINTGGNKHCKNQKGIIRKYSDCGAYYGIEFFNNIEGHDLYDYTLMVKQGHGWYVHPNDGVTLLCGVDEEFE